MSLVEAVEARYLYRAVRGDSSGGGNSLIFGLMSTANAFFSPTGVFALEDPEDGGV